MSMLIGYWSDTQSAQDQQQLLTKSVAAYSHNELQLSFSDSLSANRISPEQGSQRNCFGIAAVGRHIRLQSTPSSQQHETILNATLAAGGKNFPADIWAKVSSDGLYLGREVFGRATLFWTKIENAVWFASRLELLLKVLNSKRVSIEGFYAYGSFSYVPAPHTPVENVFAVSAGTELRWQSPGTSPKSRTLHQWREAEVQDKDESGAAQTLRRMLEESAEVQLASYAGEPIGIFLSGGLDSSLTAALLARAGAKVRAFTLDFAADCFSEVAQAELVARTLGIPLTKIQISAGSMRRNLAPTAARLNGLYGDGVTVPLAIMFQRAAEEVETVFNGEGGDQLFAGWTNKPLIAASVYENPASLAYTEPQAFAALYMRTFHRFYGHERVYTDVAQRQFDPANLFRVLSYALDPSYTRSLLHRLRRANLLLKGADNIQPRATNLGLSYNLGVRTLFCSQSLAEWTFSVSDELWLRAGCEKYLLKRAIEDLLPPEIVWREKRGMGVPLTFWLNGQLRRWCQRSLHRRILSREGLWEPDLPERISKCELSGHIQGRRIGESLWLMLMWRTWRDEVLGYQSTSADGRELATFPFSLPLISTLKRA